MSCCCPPAISALFCLWARSGFSKSSVAGALTFFPPDPPLYKFTKVPPHQEASNNDHSNDEDDANKDHDEKDKMIQRNVHNTAVDKNVYKDTRKDPQETHALVKNDHDDDDEGNSNTGTATATTATASSRNTTNTAAATNTTTNTTTGTSSPLRPAQDAGRPLPPSPTTTTTSPSSSTIPPTSTTDPSLTTPIQSSPPAATVEANVHPATALMQRSLQLRQEAKHKNRQDAQDASKGMKYTFHPDPRLVPPPGYSGSIEAVKIPHLQDGTSSKTSSSPKLSLSCRNGSQDGSDINHVACVIYRIREDRVTERTKTIIYSHGNATDIGAMHFMQVVIAKGLRCNVVMYDYSGYGESGGFAVEENTYKDIEAVYQYVLDHVVVNKNERNIILYGQSVGGGPSCYLAAKKKDVGGLILHSAFMSGMRILTPSRALACLDIFPNILRIQKVQCPVMIIHGMLDEEVGFEHGVALHDAVPDHCKRNPWWVRDRGHNDITDGRQKILEYIQKLKTFLDSLMED